MQPPCSVQQLIYYYITALKKILVMKSPRISKAQRRRKALLLLWSFMVPVSAVYYIDTIRYTWHLWKQHGRLLV